MLEALGVLNCKLEHRTKRLVLMIRPKQYNLIINLFAEYNDNFNESDVDVTCQMLTHMSGVTKKPPSSDQLVGSSLMQRMKCLLKLNRICYYRE